MGNANYDQDFYAWTMENAKRLRQGRLAELDVDNIAEELESMGRSERRQLSNRLEVLVAHLLKWRFQPERRGNSWRYTIEEQRRKVRRLLRDSPSLNPRLDDELADAYEDAVLLAARETQRDKGEFPSSCPFTADQLLDDAYWPD
jgi:hypothetical protein